MIEKIQFSTKLYLDANIIIYFQEGAAELQELVAVIVADAVARDATLATSEISMVECLRGAFKQRKPALADTYRAFFHDEEVISLIPVALPLLDLAAQIAAEHSLKTVDAIHVASAVLSGCDLFLTNDRRLRAPANLPVVMISDL